jgi:hypothetical protein
VVVSKTFNKNFIRCDDNKDAGGRDREGGERENTEHEERENTEHEEREEETNEGRKGVVGGDGEYVYKLGEGRSE